MDADDISAFVYSQKLLSPQGYRIDSALFNLRRMQDDVQAANAHLSTLLERSASLLNELEAFRVFLEEERAQSLCGGDESLLDLRPFQNPTKREAQSLEKVIEKHDSPEKTLHSFKSSNIPYYCAVWDAAKNSKALRAFYKRFFSSHQRSDRTTSEPEKHLGAVVDIVANDGADWIKVSTISERRMVFELEKLEWENHESSESEGSISHEGPTGEHLNSFHSGNDATCTYEKTQLFQNMKALLHVSRTHRKDYKHPTVKLYMPNISDSPSSQLLPLLGGFKALGVQLYTGAATQCKKQGIEELRTTVFPSLVHSPRPQLTNPLNIDCTILLALVSDLSHMKDMSIEPSYRREIRQQIKIERRGQLLSSFLWPGMVGKALLCTEEAASRMKAIVDAIGTSNESRRTSALMGWPSDQVDGMENAQRPHRDALECRQRLQDESDYHVPESLNLPITVIADPTKEETSTAVAAGHIPPISHEVADMLSEVNHSVFMYGWLNGLTTVTSNRVVVKSMEAIIEKNRMGEESGPLVWLREPARSLLGKEKERLK